ncbi:hypothetical protein EC991_004596 [Linnemannia zychae]|nr:hypothetical protein EC991_004596 [Linnemannia zychae]
MITFSPCGGRIASTSRDGTIRLWCVQTGAVLNVFDNSGASRLAIAFSPCGNHVIAASQDNTLRLWNALTGELGHVLKGHTDPIRGVVYSPSGHQIATSSKDRTVRLWNAVTGEQLFTLGHPEEVRRVKYTPDGHEITSMSLSEGFLRFWDPQSGRQLNQSGIYSANISDCCYSPDGNYIATVSFGGYLQLWGRSADDLVEVFRTETGTAFEIEWRQGSQHMYLTTGTFGCMRVWQLMADNGTFQLRLLWSLNKKELFLSDANLCGAIGLSPVDLELVKQRGATTDSKGDSIVIEQ